MKKGIEWKLVGSWGSDSEPRERDQDCLSKETGTGMRSIISDFTQHIVNRWNSLPGNVMKENSNLG